MNDWDFGTDYLNKAGTAAIPSSSGFNFNDFLSKGVNYGKDALGFLNSNAQGIGVLGGLYSAYTQQDMANKSFDLQRQAFNYNKMLSEREKKRQEDAEKAMQLGFANSGLGA